MKIRQIILLILIFCCCSSCVKEKKNSESVTESISETTSTIDNLTNTSTTLLFDTASTSKTQNIFGKSGLLTNLQGSWVNTSLFDSTSIKKQLSPWLNDFYGDLLLVINGSDSAAIYGNMDGGESIMEVIDSITFAIPDRYDYPTFTYSLENDLIFQIDKYNDSIIFRRVRKNDNLEIIANEKTFNQFFINKFFSDYFSDNEKVKIVEIWDGFETYRPFDFDAVAIKDENKIVSYYAWEILRDTLYLYETSYEYDDNSGFPDYKIEDLKQKIVKK